ncbi:MAG TPA: alpha-mannosidase, partial [Pedococcus sp.]|nr:alpha-mannosidase [Pedococcus sp.]
MHDDRQLIEGRLARMLGRIAEAVWCEPEPVELACWEAPGEPVPVAEGLAAAYEPAQVGQRWGAPWGTTWWRVRGTVPEPHAGRVVDLRLDLGFNPDWTGFHAEGLVHRADGTPVKGLNPRTQWVRVADEATGGEQVELFVESASNPMLLGGPGFAFQPNPLGDPETAGDEPLYRVARAELAVFEQEVWELQQDLEVLGQLAAELPLEDARRWELLRALDRALDLVDVADIAGTAPAARAELAAAFTAPARASAHRISAVGHAHIDSAWLWPVRETVRKVARTCANVVDLMDSHPDFVYAMSSAQQFAWLKEHRPAVWERVVERVREGRFVPVGGMWVESDTNMPGGEALVRQLNHGKRFFLDELGVETREVWLPDSFGYTAAMPQLVALSGSQWFLTQKISWNTTNRFPHHTFRWEGLDGTRVFTHFPPVDTYNSEISGAELAHAERNFADKGAATRSLVPFGWGDGGGGPTREMLARAARLRDLDGSPRVEVERPDAFFAAAEAEYPDAPIWVGELYLEFHRGTYTSQARTKRGNRRSEHLLREAELWAATAAVRTGAAYPREDLDRIWKVVLLNQFHDILPGSSIAWVH